MTIPSILLSGILIQPVFGTSLGPHSKVLTGSLPEGGTEAVLVNLTEGATYALVGSCRDAGEDNGECQGFDLSVDTWPQRQRLADAARTPSPVASFAAPYSGEFQVSVTMRWCASDLCDWELHTWESQAGRTEHGDESELNVFLESGVSYRLAGLCSEDCGEIRLGLYAPSGRLIAERAYLGYFGGGAITSEAYERITLRNRRAILHHHANRTGLHRIVVRVTNCRDKPRTARGTMSWRRSDGEPTTCPWTVRLSRIE